jgi:peptidoglycan pentaglycine glycine transferase (the first glycine)
MPIVNSSDWDAFFSNHPDSHILQSGLWGELKSKFNWEIYRVISEKNIGSEKEQIGAQILIRSILSNWSVAYIPKGPIGAPGSNIFRKNTSNFWKEIDQLCKSRNAIFLIVEPDNPFSQGVSASENIEGKNLPPVGFQRGFWSVQPKQTIIIDINGSDEEILAHMKQKTRYNIRLAERKEVSVSTSNDLNAFYSLMILTGERDRFGVHSERYYKLAYELFYPSSKCELFFAKYQDELIAAIMVFASGKRAWYFYGASSETNRHRMPNYLLQWRAIQWARDRDCEYYDLWGIPDESIENLEGEFTSRSDGLWGVYRFKRGFGGRIMRSSGPWDRVYSPVLYRLFKYYNNFRGLSLN